MTAARRASPNVKMSQAMSVCAAGFVLSLSFTQRSVCHDAIASYFNTIAAADIMSQNTLIKIKQCTVGCMGDIAKSFTIIVKASLKKKPKAGRGTETQAKHAARTELYIR